MRRKLNLPDYTIMIVDIPARDNAREVFGTFRLEKGGAKILNETPLLKKFGVIYVYDKIDKKGFEYFNQIDF
jgi:hypothetical protein